MAAGNVFRFLSVQCVRCIGPQPGQSLALPFLGKGSEKEKRPRRRRRPLIITGWAWEATFTRWVTDVRRRGIARGGVISAALLRIWLGRIRRQECYELVAVQKSSPLGPKADPSGEAGGHPAQVLGPIIEDREAVGTSYIFGRARGRPERFYGVIGAFDADAAWVAGAHGSGSGCYRRRAHFRMP